jgi:hypothetical protein
MGALVENKISSIKRMTNWVVSKPTAGLPMPGQTQVIIKILSKTSDILCFNLTIQIL